MSLVVSKQRRIEIRHRSIIHQTMVPAIAEMLPAMLKGLTGPQTSNLEWVAGVNRVQAAHRNSLACPLHQSKANPHAGGRQR